MIDSQFSFKKLVTGGEVSAWLYFSKAMMLNYDQLSESIFTGPGEVLIAPETWGDIVPINMDGSTTWFFGKHSFLAATREVIRSNKSQGVGKALCESTWG